MSSNHRPRSKAVTHAGNVVSKYGGGNYREHLHDIEPVTKGPYNDELALVVSQAADIILRYGLSYTVRFDTGCIPSDKDLRLVSELLETLCMRRENCPNGSDSVKIPDNDTIIKVSRLLGEVYDRRGRANAAHAAFERALKGWTSSWPTYVYERLRALTIYMKFLSPVEIGKVRATQLLEIATSHWSIALDIISRVGVNELANHAEYNKYLGLPLDFLYHMANAIAFANMSIGQLDEARLVLSQCRPLLDEENGFCIPLSHAVDTWHLHAQVCEGSSSTLSDTIDLYREAWVRSALLLGPWNFKTLTITENFSNVLLSDDIEPQWLEPRLRLFSELCLASYYNPGFCLRTERAFEHLAKHLPNSSVVSHLSNPRHSRWNANQLRLSYMRSTLSTAVELFSFVHGSMTDYSSLETEILLLLRISGHRPLIKQRLFRELSMSRYMRDLSNGVSMASSLIPLSRYGNDAPDSARESDLAILGSRNVKDAWHLPISPKVFFVDDKDEQWPGFYADVRARLSRWSRSHFDFQSDVLPLIHRKTVGHGSFASVDLVEIKGRQFARKVTIAVRRDKEAIRQSILREVEVMRLLHHPHIVSVFCTYEKEQQFGIILEPAADCDLEGYLDHFDFSELERPGSELRATIIRWMLCLICTLDHIHRKNVRHKDIKSKNILVKNKRILFADFGSSCVFSEETSTTEGPPIGHTRMYSAPEVINEEKRNKSADIFSLGCVFSEMLTVMTGRTTNQYRQHRRIEVLDHPQNGSSAYYATLDRVESWFLLDRPGVRGDLMFAYTELVKPMMEHQAQKRPTAPELRSTAQNVFHLKDFCDDCSRRDSISPTDGLETSELLGLLPLSLERID